MLGKRVLVVANLKVRVVTKPDSTERRDFAFFSFS